MPGEEFPILKKSTEAAGNFLSSVAGGAIGELNAMWADRVRQKRFERALDRLEGVAKRCEEAGIESPREVALTVLVPWLENASLEEDPDLHEMWESLLANAADPREERKQTHRSFVRILKQIEAVERIVLEALYQINDELGNREGPTFVIDPYPDNDRIKKEIEKIGFRVPSHDELQFAKINITRLGLCSRGGNATLGGAGPLSQGSNPPEPQEGPHSVHISDFGRVFYEACQPPEKTPDIAKN